jgi:hypothetical protein
MPLISTPTAPAALNMTSEPSSLAQLSPAALQTPRSSPQRHLPLSHCQFDELAVRDEDEFHTPERSAASPSSDVEAVPSQVWAPQRHDGSRFGAFRRSDESSSDEGSPMLSGNMASPMWARCALASQHGECTSSDDGADTGAGRLVCNLAERFNNAHFYYDGINGSP